MPHSWRLHAPTRDGLSPAIEQAMGQGQLWYQWYALESHYYFPSHSLSAIPWIHASKVASIKSKKTIDDQVAYGEINKKYFNLPLPGHLVMLS